MRRNLVTILACIIAIVAVADNVRTKQEAVEALLKEPTEVRINGIPMTEKVRDETIEKLITRIGLLQKCLNEHGLYNEQPVVDDGLRLPGVYPQLRYGDPPGPQFGVEESR